MLSVTFIGRMLRDFLLLVSISSTFLLNHTDSNAQANTQVVAQWVNLNGRGYSSKAYHDASAKLIGITCHSAHSIST